MQLKGLERVGKRVATRAIAAMMSDGRRTHGERPDWRERPYRVLFLRHDKIGDMIVSTGILRSIAQAYPNLQLDVLASNSNAIVIRNDPHLHEVIAFDRKSLGGFPTAFRELRRRHYDAVIDCMVTAPSTTTLLLMLASGARHRIGVADRGNDFAYTVPVPPREHADHIVDKLATLVTAFGLQPTAVDVRPRVKLTTEELKRGERAWRGGDPPRKNPRLLVNISAGRAHHWWPDDRFELVIRSASDRFRNADIVVVSSPSDRERASGIAERTGARLMADEGIRDAMSIVACADVVFTPDTSISHACSAFDKPVVVMHPRGFAKLGGPYQTEGRAIESARDSVLGISAEDASRVLIRMMESLAG